MDSLREQFALHEKVNAELTLVHDTVLDIRAARATLDARKKADPALAPQIDAAEAKMTAIEEELIQPRAHASEDALNYPVKLNNMIAALGSLVDEGDFAPTAQDEQEYVQLKSEADAQIAAWNALKAGELTRLMR
jgi:capsule polysaccharide export protein KpsE/RkpR